MHSAAAAIFSGVEWLLRDGVIEAVMIKMKTPTEERCDTMCDPFFSWLTLFKRPADDCLLLVWRHFHAHRREVGEIVLRGGGGGQDRRTRQQEQDNDRPTNHPPTLEQPRSARLSAIPPRTGARCARPQDGAAWDSVAATVAVSIVTAARKDIEKCDRDLWINNTRRK